MVLAMVDAAGRGDEARRGNSTSNDYAAFRLCDPFLEGKLWFLFRWNRRPFSIEDGSPFGFKLEAHVLPRSSDGTFFLLRN